MSIVPMSIFFSFSTRYLLSVFYVICYLFCTVLKYFETWTSCLCFRLLNLLSALLPKCSTCTGQQGLGRSAPGHQICLRSRAIRLMFPIQVSIRGVIKHSLDFVQIFGFGSPYFAIASNFLYYYCTSSELRKIRENTYTGTSFSKFVCDYREQIPLPTVQIISCSVFSVPALLFSFSMTKNYYINGNVLFAKIPGGFLYKIG